MHSNTRFYLITTRFTKKHYSAPQKAKKVEYSEFLRPKIHLKFQFSRKPITMFTEHYYYD